MALETQANAVRLRPELFVGAASPLWGYFAGAALGGLALWWLSRWTRPANLEATVGMVLATPLPLAIQDMAQEGVELSEETLEEAAGTVEAMVCETAVLAEGALDEAVESIEAAVEAVSGPAGALAPFEPDEAKILQAYVESDPQADGADGSTWADERKSRAGASGPAGLA